MPVTLTDRPILLCEGEADYEFFRKLIERRNLPPFQFPFSKEENSQGKDRFMPMLDVLATEFSRAPERKRLISGVFIVVDSTDAPEQAFRNVVNQIRQVGEFGCPTAVLQIATSLNHFPPVGISLIPGPDMPGALETLCLAARKDDYSIESRCVEELVKCCGIVDTDWGREKLDKAKFASLIAVSYPANPTRGTRNVFSDYKGEPAAIDVTSRHFNGVAAAVLSFCEQVNALA